MKATAVQISKEVDNAISSRIKDALYAVSKSPRVYRKKVPVEKNRM